MKNYRLFSLPVFFLLMLMFTLPGQAQFMMLARKIKGMHTPSADVATVILDAKPSGVYKAMIDTLTTNPKFRVTNKDQAKYLVEFTKEQCKVSMQVDSLDKALSQITVSATASDNNSEKTSSVAVDAIQNVCKKLGIKCTVKE
jgi:hypothetical protein